MKKPKDYLILYLKGIAMGAADVVPGVSGGTVAFISGIYEELLNSIKSFDLKAIQLFISLKFKAFWQHTNATFLIVLLSGIGTSILSLSKLIQYLLEFYPILIWSFFFGLIIASTVVVSQKITRWTIATVISLLIGLAFGYLITVAGRTQTPETTLFVFLSGVIAICAMILPGISGSFILVLLDKYKFILAAVTSFDLKTVFTFLVGCVVGILAFSHVVSWLLKHYHNLTIACLTGIMAGSLNKVWPWKETLETFENSRGEIEPLREQSVSPFYFQDVVGQEPYIFGAILLAVFGFVIVYFLERFAGQSTTKV
ncbi:MAG: DUF368 domain-containing protein [Microscillaceae bacterium]|nr:DUF368 domain-containing protein [Microscillaceae bacterium]